MASISGSQFTATGPNNQPVVVAETADGNNLPPPVAGQFNLEVWTGPGAPGTPAPGYQGLAIVGPGGTTITLVSGAFAVQDTATGGVLDILTADGDDETIQGGPGNNDIFNVNGNNDVVIGGGQDFINVNGDKDTVDGVGNDLVQIHGSNASINGGGGNDTILAYAGSNGDTINAFTGTDLVLTWGNNESIVGGAGNDTILALSGNSDTIVGGNGSELIGVWGTGEAVAGGGGNDTILALQGSTGDTIQAQGGNDVIYVLDQHDTVVGGSGNDTIGLYAANDAFFGQTGVYSLQAIGNNETISGGGEHGNVLAVGAGDSIFAGLGGASTIEAIGDNNTILGSGGPMAAGGQITSFGNDDAITPERNMSVTVGGIGDTVNFGSQGAGDGDTVTLLYGTQTLADNGGPFADTVVGFNQAGGDRIHLAANDTATSTQVNGGQDTLITLSDNSTILLKGVTHIDNSFFS